MKRLFFALILVVASVANGYCQFSYFVDVQGNYSLISTVEKSATVNFYSPALGYYSTSFPQFTLVESYDSKPGFDVLLGVQRQLSSKFTIETGLGLTLTRYKRNIHLKSVGDNNLVVEEFPVITGQPIGSLYGDIRYIDLDSGGDYRPLFQNSENVGKTQLYHLTVPLTLNYQLIDNRLSVGTGFSVSYLVRSQQITSELRYEGLTGGIFETPNRWNPDNEETYAPRFVIADNKNRSGDGLTKFVGNFNLNAQYRILQNIWLNATYQQGLSPIYEEEQRTAGTAKNRLVKLGLRYYLGF